MTEATPYLMRPHELERRARIQLSVATYAYEVMDTPVMPDALWDLRAQNIKPLQGTAHPLMDEFFRHEFSPMTGMWIHDHPELSGIKRIYDGYWLHMRGHFEKMYRLGKLQDRRK